MTGFVGDTTSGKDSYWGAYQVKKERGTYKRKHTTQSAGIPPFDDDLLASIHYAPQYSVPTTHHCARKVLRTPRRLPHTVVAALER